MGRGAAGWDGGESRNGGEGARRVWYRGAGTAGRTGRGAGPGQRYRDRERIGTGEQQQGSGVGDGSGAKEGWGPGQRHHPIWWGLKPQVVRPQNEGCPHRAQGVWSPGQGHCHLAWVSHIAQHLGWAAGLDHLVLLVLHHYPERQWSRVNRS